MIKRFMWLLLGASFICIAFFIFIHFLIYSEIDKKISPTVINNRIKTKITKNVVKTTATTNIVTTTTNTVTAETASTTSRQSKEELKATKWHTKKRKLAEQYLKRIPNNKGKAYAENDKPVCVIPEVNPFGIDAMDYWEHFSKEKCEIKKVSKIKNHRLVVHNENRDISLVSIAYVRRGRKRAKNGDLIEWYRNNTHNIMDKRYKYHDVINDDFHVHFTKEREILKNRKGEYTYPLTDDFVRVTIVLNGTKLVEYHAHILNKTNTCSKHGKKLKEQINGLPFNVAMVMIDSQSRANVERQLPNMMEILRNDPNTLLFDGFGIHGDGTTSQVLAFTAGIVYSQDVQSPWEYPHNNHCDDIDFIFNDFKKAGYTTMYNEDSATGGTYQYRLNGFDKSPTDWYTRPYWIAAHGQYDGCGKYPCICESIEILRLLKEYTIACEEELKYSLTMLNQAHDEMNKLYFIEETLIDIIEFFKEKSRKENTIFMLFSDHGARAGARDSFRSTHQGKLEELLPFYAVTLPPIFKKKYKELYETMISNTGVLTSHFDMYATLKHIISYPDLPKDMPKYGQSLFTKINPKTRTCNSTGIPSRFCPCLGLDSVSKDCESLKPIIQAVIDYINNKLFTVKEVCVKLTLKSIISAWKKDWMDTEENTMRTLYEVSFKVSPSDATFEAQVDFTNDTISVNPELSRTNLYGDQSMCIKYQYPKLAPFCFCSTHLRNS